MAFGDTCIFSVAALYILSTSFIHIIPPLLFLFACVETPCSVRMMIQTTYFYDEQRCGFQHLTDVFPQELNITYAIPSIKMPEVSKWGIRFSLIMKLIIAIDCCWMVVSIVLLWIVFGRGDGPKKSLTLFLWSIVGLVSISVDIIGILITSNQMLYVFTFEDWLDLLGAERGNLTYQTSKRMRNVVRAAPFNLLCYFLRLIIFLVANIVLVVRALYSAFNTCYDIS